eukprot:m.103779 g.103779  ORF g.103779 m.103779 type:complete len:55 (+) comp15231_c0_seq8:1082-1246(+)
MLSKLIVLGTIVGAVFGFKYADEFRVSQLEKQKAALQADIDALHDQLELPRKYS